MCPTDRCKPTCQRRAPGLRAVIDSSARAVTDGWSASRRATRFSQPFHLPRYAFSASVGHEGPTSDVPSPAERCSSIATRTNLPSDQDSYPRPRVNEHRIQSPEHLPFDQEPLLRAWLETETTDQSRSTPNLDAFLPLAYWPRARTPVGMTAATANLF